MQQQQEIKKTLNRSSNKIDKCSLHIVHQFSSSDWTFYWLAECGWSVALCDQCLWTDQSSVVLHKQHVITTSPVLTDLVWPGLFYKHLCDSLASEWSFVNISTRHLHSQTVRARELTFWDKVHPPPVTCHMSHFMWNMSRVTCHVSHVTCRMSCVTCHMSLFIFFYQAVKLVVEGLLSTRPT